MPRNSPIIMLHRANGGSVDTSFERTSLGDLDPFASVREVGRREESGLAAGRIALDGVVQSSDYPHSEALIVVEGTLGVVEDGAEAMTLRSQEGVVIGRGTALTLDPGHGARVVFCAVPGVGEKQPGLARLRADADFSPAPPLPAELLVGPAGMSRKDNVFTDSATRFHAGVFDCTAVERLVRGHLVHEFMHIIDGVVHLPVENGDMVVVGAGDTLFVPKHSRIAWANKDRVAKFYCSQEV